VRRGWLLTLAIVVTGCGHHAAKPHAFRMVVDEYGDNPTKIVWLDHRSPPILVDLHPEPGTRLFAPDRRRVAIGGDEARPRLHILDLATRRLWASRPLVRAPYGGCGVTPLVWTVSDHVVATVWCGDAHRTAASAIAGVDVDAKRLLWSRPLGLVFGASRTRERAVLLTSPPMRPELGDTGILNERIGRARLLVVGRDGVVHARTLPIRAGLGAARTFNREPGFAVRGETAIIVAEGDGAALVDLRTLRVDDHRVAFPPRPRRLAPQPVMHTGTTNPSRDLVRKAFWVDRHHVVVTGSDTWTHRGYDTTLGAGVRILDTRTWKTRLVDPTAAEVQRTRRYLVAWDAGPAGLRVYDHAGRLVLRRFVGRFVWVDSVRRDRIVVHVWRNVGHQRRYTVMLP
jgi:hypothetical protein